VKEKITPVSLRLEKTRRLLRQLPDRVLRDWCKAFLSEGNLLSFGLAVMTSYVGLETAAFPKFVEEAQGWANGFLALLYVSIGWLIVCLVRAPFKILVEERQIGTWFGNLFTFREPYLVASIRAKATGKAEFHKIHFQFAAPSAFVYYHIEIENERTSRHLFSASVVGEILMMDQLQPGVGLRQGGTRILPDQTANLVIAMKPEMLSQTFRVYCRSFTIGNPEPNDGAVGDNTPAWVAEKAEEEN
jgi:hypothetical protein